jgi:uncharacterized oligopeptide transporter (OPT) family protein
MEYFLGQGVMILFAAWAMVEMARFFVREARATVRSRRGRDG